MDMELFLIPGVRLGNPSAWVWVLVSIIVGLSFFWGRGGKNPLYQLIHPDNRKTLVCEDSKNQNIARNLCYFLAIFFCSLSLLVPKWGFQWEDIRRRGVDLILAVDVSKSMLAEDLAPNRLVRAKRKILDLLDLVQGDRIGLVAFAGTSYLQCPLTLDYGAFRMFLDLLDTDLIPQQGTAIDQAIATAMDAFENSGMKSRALVLITDGEEHSGAYLEAAKEAAARGIRIYTLGIGSPEGHPVPDPQNRGQSLKDQSGNIVFSRLNETILQEIALETGGVYVRATTSDDDLQQIYSREILEKLELQDLKTTRQKRYEPRFQVFLLIGAFFLCLGSFLSRYQLPIFQKQIMILLLVVGLPTSLEAKGLMEYFGFPSPVESEVRSAVTAYDDGKYEEAVSGFSQAEISLPEDPVNSLNLGNSYYQNGDFSRAREYYQRALSMASKGSGEQSSEIHREVQSRAGYNLGNTAYRLGQLEDSISHYEKVLESNPEHEKARRNLEFVRKKLKEHQQKQQNQGQNQQQNQGENQQQNQGESQNQDQNQQGQQGQDEKSGEQSPDQQKGQEPGKGQEPQKSEKEQENQKQDSEQEEQSQSRTPEETGSNPDQNPTSEDSSRARIQRLSKEEAQRFLNRLSKENSEQMKRYIQYRLKGKGSSLGKEW